MQLARKRPLHTIAILGLIAAAGTAQISAAGKAATSADPADPLLGRVVTIGASVSSGFGNNFPPAKVLDEAITVPHKKIHPANGIAFFLQPLRIGKMQVDRSMRSAQPTLVVGIDFLFWYGYGQMFGTEEQKAEKRLARLEIGIKQLERYKCPVMVGDIPDMHGAHPSMLPPRMIPTKKNIGLLNKRIHAWVKSKPNVTLLPLAKWVVEMKGGKFAIPASADGKYPKTPLPQSKALLGDRLHPTKIGVILLAERIVELIKAEHSKSAKGIDVNVWKMLDHFGLVEEALRKPGATSRPAHKVGH